MRKSFFVFFKTGFAVAAFSFISCNNQEKKEYLAIEVSNQLDFDREEIVSLDRSELSAILNRTSEDNIRILQEGHEDALRTQWIDYDRDGKADELLFFAAVGSKATTKFWIVLDSTLTVPQSDVVAYSRFVPERTDDYTWENDKVAFRTYGPTGQREALEGVPGSTLSSGIDLWLKRTDKSIIDKWYSEHQKSPGYYHEDHGEGYDPYHVGASRGTGGSGVWVEDSLQVSQNYTNYRTLADGPLRTLFELEYNSWSEFGIKETKRISLDLGSRFSKFEVTIDSQEEIPNYAVGISLHNNKGEAKINEQQGWVRHWETIDGAGVGEALVMQPQAINSAFARRTSVTDQSNLLILTQPEDQKVVYYAGFAWEKYGEIESVEEWDAYLNEFSQTLRSPLEVKIIH